MAADAPLTIDSPISGYDGTFLDGVEAGVVPAPPLMPFNEWQAWRSTEGKRPTVARDQRSTTTRQESVLWRSVMEARYGATWHEDLAIREQEAAEEAEKKEQAEIEARTKKAADAAFVDAGKQVADAAAREAQRQRDAVAGATRPPSRRAIPSTNAI